MQTAGHNDTERLLRQGGKGHPHPTGKHVCQCCGKEKSLFYEYPTQPTLKRLNMAFGLELEQTDYTISEFVTKFCKTWDSWTKWRKY